MATQYRIAGRFARRAPAVIGFTRLPAVTPTLAPRARAVIGRAHPGISDVRPVVESAPRARQPIRRYRARRHRRRFRAPRTPTDPTPTGAVITKK